MKKTTFSLILAAFLLTYITAFADNYRDLFSHADSAPETGSVSIDISAENMKNFDFLEKLEGNLGPYSLKDISESIFSSSVHIDVSYKTRNNRKIIEAYAEAAADTPLKMNDNLVIRANAVFNIWAYMNFENENDPKYYITVKSPIDGKYYVFDSTAADSFKIYPSELRKKKLMIALQNALYDNSKLLVNRGIFSLSLSDTQLKNVMSSLVNNSYNTLYLYFNGSDSDRTNYITYMHEASAALQRLNSIQILGKSGLKLDFKFSKDGILNEAEYNIDLETNIFKMYYAATGKEMPPDPNAEKPVINADNSDIHIALKVNLKYKTSHTSFKYPSPPKDMTVDVYRSTTYTLSYTTNDTYVSPYEIVPFSHKGVCASIDGEPYIPLRAMMNALGVPDENITWDDGCIYIEGNESVPFDALSVQAGNETVYADYCLYTLSRQAVIQDDVMLVPSDFVQKILGAKVIDYVTSYKNEYMSYYTTIRIERLKPVYYEQLKNAAALPSE